MRGPVVQLLDLVEAAFLAGLVLDRPQPGGEVVDEGDVGDRPDPGLQRLPHRGEELGGVVRVEDPLGVPGQAARVGQPQEDLPRIQLGPPPLEERRDLEVVLEPAHELLALGVPALPVGRIREELDHRVAREVALVLAQRPGADLVEGLAAEPHGDSTEVPSIATERPHG